MRSASNHRVGTRLRPGSRGVGVALFIGLLSVASLSHANQWCKGKITSVLTDSAGNVMVLTTFRGDWLMACSITAPWKGVAVETCKSWLGTLTALRLTQEPALMFYAEDTACSSIPTYSNAPSPGYVAVDTP